MTQKTKVVIAGGSGSLGLSLAKHFQNLGHEVVILTRKQRPQIEFKQIVWNGLTVSESWASQLKDSILINLSGEIIDRVPTKKNIALLQSSRVEPTKALVAAVGEFGKPKLWLQMSTLAIYGDGGDEIFTEDSAAAANGLPQQTGVTKAWEAALGTDLNALADRIVIMRTAVVLQRNTPGLNRLTSVTKKFLGGTIGNGKQWFSWIHHQDFVNAIDFFVANEKLSGVFNMTGPEPVTNKHMMAVLRKQFNRPWTPPTPAFAIIIGGWLLFRTDPQLALTGRRGYPKRLLENGFTFKYPNFEQAIADLCSDDH